MDLAKADEALEHCEVIALMGSDQRFDCVRTIFQCGIALIRGMENSLTRSMEDDNRAELERRFGVLAPHLNLRFYTSLSGSDVCDVWDWLKDSKFETIGTLLRLWERQFERLPSEDQDALLILMFEVGSSSSGSDSDKTVTQADVSENSSRTATNF